MFRAVHNLRYHYTRNLEKGGRGVGKLRAVERRWCQHVSAPQRGVGLQLVIEAFPLFAISVRILNLGNRVAYP